MSFFRRQASSAPRAPEPSRPQDKATVADVLLAYRLILKREADPSGLAAYTQRVAEGLTLRELIDSLLDSPEREERIRAGVGEQVRMEVDGSLIDPKDVMRRYSVEELNETADEYYQQFRLMQDRDLNLRKPFASVDETPELLENLGARSSADCISARR